ncbi:MAG: hypothetical protein JWM76_2267 [Pseudonocardiales bacterium]|nr:hypothetical protein [Pseudonocardiales bacterium]
MPHSARLAVWTTAWLVGDVAFDDVLEAMERGGATHVVVGLPIAIAAQRNQLGGTVGSELGTELHSPVVEADTAGADRLGAALIAWRAALIARRAASIAWRAATPVVRVVFPAPGDVRGLPGPGPYTTAALHAGQAVLGGGLGLVPTETANPLSSARPLVTWRAYPVSAPAPDPLQLSEATHDLAVAMRETASLFTAADLTGTRADVGGELARARRVGELIDLPPGFPQRATALVAQAERLSIALDLALSDADGLAVDRAAMGTRAQALRALAATVRRTRQAAYNADRV